MINNLNLKNTNWKKTLLKIIFLAVVILLVIWVNSLNIQDSAVQDYVDKFGYAGLFLISVISGFNVIIPIPVAAFFPVLMELGFNAVLTIAIISFGMLAGDALGYVIGSTGRFFIEDNKPHVWLKRIEILAEKNKFLPMIFLTVYASVVPLPNELVVIPMAFMKYKWWHMMLALFLGNTVFNTLFALGFSSLSMAL